MPEDGGVTGPEGGGVIHRDAHQANGGISEGGKRVHSEENIRGAPTYRGWLEHHRVRTCALSARMAGCPSPSMIYVSSTSIRLDPISRRRLLVAKHTIAWKRQEYSTHHGLTRVTLL